MVFPAVDDTLAAEVLRAVGAAATDPVETVAARFRSWLPAGSTAKWRAVDRGEDPPGVEPETALEARLDGSLDSWSCWPVCTGLGAVLASAGHDVRLAVEHMRMGPHAAPVDYHSVLVVDGQLLDPYLGPSAPVPPGGDVTRPDAWAGWVPGVRPDHLGNRGGGGTYRYRQLADHLDRRDVRAFCAISATHTGVGRRRSAHWLRDARLWTVREGDDGRSVLRVSSGTTPFDQRRRLVDEGRFEDLMARIDDPAEDLP